MACQENRECSEVWGLNAKLSFTQTIHIICVCTYIFVYLYV